MPNDIPPRRFLVPRDDRSLLCVPPAKAVPRIVDENRRQFAESTVVLNGRSLQDLRTATRREALALARQYTSRVVESDLPNDEGSSVVVTGHQPELFHVGVWSKNFVLSGVARQTRTIPINLIIDNDTMHGTTLSVPAGSRQSPSIERIPFDTAQSGLPWEEAKVSNRQTFQRFGVHVRNQILKTWGYDPLVGNAWTAAASHLEVSDRLCDALAALRIQTERSWGLENLELPMSMLCETDSFRWFAAHLFARLPELQRIYNDSVDEYRQQHRLRNRMQPVPDLDREGEWMEAPFWIWRAQSSHRGRLYVRPAGRVCELRDEKEIVAQLPMSPESSLDSAVTALRELSQRGYRLRTRALTTTLFARVCLAEMFVHGIGGAKYDAITDQICVKFFGQRAPEFLTVSATLYLPLGGPFTTNEHQLRDVNHKIRDLAYNPDRHLEDSPETRPWVTEKARLLTAAHRERALNPGRGRLTREQHHRLSEIRSQLLAYAGNLRNTYESERKTILSRISANQLIRNREFSFVLYPEEDARRFLTPLADTLSTPALETAAPA